jgi:uncharacterized protein YggE
MNRMGVALVFSCLLCGTLTAQQVAVTQSNRTIAVTADDSASVDPDLAIVTIGYENYARTEKEAYEENVRMANSVVEAMVKAGLDKRFIESGNLSVERVEQDDKWTPEERKLRQFSAHQSWRIKVPTDQAQKLVDVAVYGGANNVGNVTWEVVDRAALQAKAGASALAKARTIAERMAAGLNAKLGPLVYASNKAPEVQSFPVYGLLATNATTITKSGGGEGSQKLGLILFPQKVKESATVHAVFAIE